MFLFREEEWYGVFLWIEEPKLTVTDPNFVGSFGKSVAIRGDRMVAVGGGTNDAGIPVGFGYVFRRDGIDWIQEARLSASDAALYDQFGKSVAVAKGLIVVGAPGVDGGGGSHAGALYVFRRAGTSWVELTKLTANKPTPSGQLGGNVATTCQYVVTGRHVFTISADCNGNDIPDACESPGDIDGDDDADLIDFEQLHGCMTSPNAGALASGCCFFDVDLDDDVDLKDLRFFQLAFTGP